MLLAISLIFTTLTTIPAFAEEPSVNDSKITSGTVDTTTGSAVITPESMIDKLINEYGTTSLQYAVIDNGEITVSGNAGVYSKSESQEITADTMYGTGSISKIFTTASVMKLVDMGKVRLDAPVTTYLPEFTMEDPRYKDITVRMLLNHSSGLMGSTISNAFLMNDPDRSSTENLLANLKTQRLKDAPGAFSVYCNDGFTLAELVVERVSGQSFTAFIHENITTPLGMTNTKTPADDFDHEQPAKIYSGQGKTALPMETVNIIGTGGVYSTAKDMCKFAQVFMNQQGQGSQVLSKNSTTSMASPEYLKGIWPVEESGKEGSLSYGLGWDNVNGEAFLDYNVNELVKGGDTLYYHGSMVVLPEENMAAVVLSSGGSSAYDQLLAEAFLLRSLENKGKLTINSTQLDVSQLALKTTPAGVEITKNILDYTGYYAGAGSLMEVKMTTPGALTITVPSMPGYAEHYTHIGNGIFKDNTGLVEFTFTKESNGQTYLHLVGPSILPDLGIVNTNNYTAQKITSNPLTPAVQKAWEKRVGKTYFVLNEKFSSQIYTVMPPLAMIPALVEGYLGSMKIIDENLAESIVQIPGTYGRDLSDFSFYMENGFEYLNSQEDIAISEDGITQLYKGVSSVCTINSQGYAKWYKVGEVAGKSMTVKAPKNTSFSVYDKGGVCINMSMASGNTTVVLPPGGNIVFAGNAGSQFLITLK